MTNLKLLKNGTRIKDNGYNYEREKSAHINNITRLFDITETEYLPSQYRTKEQEQRTSSNNFREKVLLQKIGIPEKFSYWVNKDQIPDALEITTNKRLTLFSKTKRYSIF